MEVMNNREFSKFPHPGCKSAQPIQNFFAPPSITPEEERSSAFNIKLICGDGWGCAHPSPLSYNTTSGSPATGAQLNYYRSWGRGSAHTQPGHLASSKGGIGNDTTASRFACSPA